jgi:Protein of unknown function (DUF3102)
MSDSPDPTPGQVSTDFYTTLTPELAAELRARADRMRKCRREATQLIILADANSVEIGNELLAAKQRLQHGQFIRWLDAEIGLDIRTAQKFMNGVRSAAEHMNEGKRMLDSEVAVKTKQAPTPTQVPALVAAWEQASQQERQRFVERVGIARLFEAARPELPKPASIEKPAAGNDLDIPPALDRRKALHETRKHLSQRGGARCDQTICRNRRRSMRPEFKKMKLDELLGVLPLELPEEHIDAIERMIKTCAKLNLTPEQYPLFLFRQRAIDICEQYYVKKSMSADKAMKALSMATIIGHTIRPPGASLDHLVIDIDIMSSLPDTTFLMIPLSGELVGH